MIENRKRRPSVTTQGNVSYGKHNPLLNKSMLWPHLPMHQNLHLLGVKSNHSLPDHSHLFRTRSPSALKKEYRNEYEAEINNRIAAINALNPKGIAHIENELCQCCEEYTVRILVGKDHFGDDTIKTAIEPYPHLKRGEEWSDKFTCPN